MIKGDKKSIVFNRDWRLIDFGDDASSSPHNQSTTASSTSLVRARHDRSKRTGEWYSKPDVYDPEGYVQIVRTFVSRDHALVAQQELARAVHVYREASKVEAPTADEPDTLDEIAENFDASEAKKIKGRDRKSL